MAKKKAKGAPQPAPVSYTHLDVYKRQVQQHTAKGQPLEGRAAERGALCLGNHHKQPSKRVWIRLSVAGKSLFFVEISAWVLDKGRAG